MNTVSRKWVLGSMILAVAVVGACDQPTKPAIDNATAGDPTMARLLSLGYPQKDIRKDGNEYILQGDIAVSERWINDLYESRQRPAAVPGGARFQFTTSNPRSLAEATDIKVNLSGWSARSDLLTAMRTAMVAWNSIPGSAVHFSEVTGSSYDVYVNYYTESCTPTCQSAAHASFPHQGETQYVGWNTTADNVHNWDAAQKAYALRHELGHTLGLQHAQTTSNSYDGSTYGLVHVFTTPWQPASGGDEADSSVMSVYGGGRTWTDWNRWDVVAADFLWPAPAPTIYDAVSHSTSHPEFFWTPRAEIGVYGIYYTAPSVNGGALVYVGQTTGSTFIDTSQVTTAQITCTSTTMGYVLVGNNLNGTETLPGPRICYNHDSPPGPLTVTVEGPTVVAGGYGYGFNASVSGGYYPYTFQWYYPTSETTSSIFAPLCSSGYVKVTVSDGHTSKTDSLYVTVSGSEPPPSGADQLPCM